MTRSPVELLNCRTIVPDMYEENTPDADWMEEVVCAILPTARPGVCDEGTGFWNCSVHDKVPIVSVRPDDAMMVTLEISNVLVASTAGVTTLLLICIVSVMPFTSMFGDCSGKREMVERPGRGLDGRFWRRLASSDVLILYVNVRDMNSIVCPRSFYFLFFIRNNSQQYQNDPSRRDVILGHGLPVAEVVLAVLLMET